MKNAKNLDLEVETFYRLRPSLIHAEGKFALVAGEKLLGLFDTYPDAIAAGYKERGLKPFLVKQISSVEAVANFTRNLKVA